MSESTGQAQGGRQGEAVHAAAAAAAPPRDTSAFARLAEVFASPRSETSSAPLVTEGEEQADWGLEVQRQRQRNSIG